MGGTNRSTQGQPKAETDKDALGPLVHLTPGHGAKSGTSRLIGQTGPPVSAPQSVRDALADAELAHEDEGFFVFDVKTISESWTTSRVALIQYELTECHVRHDHGWMAGLHGRDLAHDAHLREAP